MLTKLAMTVVAGVLILGACDSGGPSPLAGDPEPVTDTVVAVPETVREDDPAPGPVTASEAGEFALLAELVPDAVEIHPGVKVEDEKRFTASGGEDGDAYAFSEELAEAFDNSNLSAVGSELARKGFTAAILRDFGVDREGVDDLKVAAVALSSRGEAADVFHLVERDVLAWYCGYEAGEYMDVAGLADASICVRHDGDPVNFERVKGAVQVDRFVAIVSVDGDPDPLHQTLVEGVLSEMPDRIVPSGD